MVRLNASEQAAKKNTDMKPDPATADLYVPRKSGDPTGQSGLINDVLTPGLTGTSATAETPEIAQAIQTAVGRPIKLGEATKLPGVSNVNGLQTGTGGVPKPQLDFNGYMAGLFDKFQDPIILEYFQQNDAAPQVVDTKKNNRYANKLKESDAV